MVRGKVHFTWHLEGFRRRWAGWFGTPLIEMNDMGHWTWHRLILLVWFRPGLRIREPASSSLSSGTSVSGLRGELGPAFQLLFSDERLRLSPWQSGFPPCLDAFPHLPFSCDFTQGCADFGLSYHSCYWHNLVGKSTLSSRLSLFICSQLSLCTPLSADSSAVVPSSPS